VAVVRRVLVVRQVLRVLVVKAVAVVALTLRRCRVLVAQAVNPLVVAVVVQAQPMDLILAQAVLAVLACAVSTLGKELTWQTDMQLWKTGLLPT